MKTNITAFENADWTTIMPKLLKYALLCTRQYSWNTQEDSLPKGQALEDIVSEAIRKTYEQLKSGSTGKGFRVWDSRSADLLTHLKGVVKSDINSLVNSKEHANREYNSTLESDENSEYEEDKLNEDVASRDDGEDAKDYYDQLVEELRIELNGDDIALKYLRTVEEIIRDGGEPKYQNIMQEGKLTFEDVKNSKRKVERAIIRIRNANLTKVKK